jgi:hypothetical protein
MIRTGTRTILFVAFVALAGGVLSAAAATRDAKTLVLRLSDFPTGTRAGPAYGLNGPSAKLYTATYEILPGDIKREEDVSIELWLAKDTASAKAVYQQTLATYTGKGPQIGAFKDAFKGESVLTLPRYGDEQYADYLPKQTRPHGQLIVRKGNVVWYLTVENCTPLAMSCYGTSRTEAPIGKAKALSELKKYGAKQRTRAGSG